MKKIDPYKRLRELDKLLYDRGKAGLSSFSDSYCVQIIDEDEGTVLFYENAIAKREGNLVYIFTEHHGTSWYNEEDTKIRFFKRVYDERMYSDRKGVFKTL